MLCNSAPACRAKQMKFWYVGYLQHVYALAFWVIHCTYMYLVSVNICANVQVLLTADVKQNSKVLGPLKLVTV